MKQMQSGIKWYFMNLKTSQTKLLTNRRRGRAEKAEIEQTAFGSLSFCLREIDLIREMRTLVPI